MVDIDHSLGKGLGSLLRRIVTDALEDSDGSAECEHIDLDPWLKKLDLEFPVSDRLGLPNQLIHALFVNFSDALFVDVDPVGGARRLSADEDSKLY